MRKQLKMTKTSSPIPIYHHERADDLRAAGPAVMFLAGYLQYASNAIGFFRLNFEKASTSIGMTAAEIKEALTVLEQIGFLRYHTETQMVWVIKHAAWTLGQLRATNRTLIVQANAEFAAVPKTCPLRVDFLWKHALMLRLEVQGACFPGDASADSDGEMPADLLPKLVANKPLRDGPPENEI